MSKQDSSQRRSIMDSTPSNSLRMLEQRLDDGYRRIDAGQRVGSDVDLWEDFWIDLLHQYEQLADRAEGNSSWDIAA
jgi:hypothetical protein